MNNNVKTDSMPRNQTLIVVEGKLEKNNILKVLFRCFPELPIRIENIHVYENDIYDLYHAIEEEYGELWFEENMEIDIPFLVSRKFDILELRMGLGEEKIYINYIKRRIHLGNGRRN